MSTTKRKTLELLEEAYENDFLNQHILISSLFSKDLVAKNIVFIGWRKQITTQMKNKPCRGQETKAVIVWFTDRLRLQYTFRSVSRASDVARAV